MSIRKQNKGVSPVIGVILMVAITVIIAAVVANFVLDLAGNLEQDADATVTFDQEVSNFGSNYYNVSVTVSQLDNADYVVVKEQTESKNVVETWSGDKPQNETAPLNSTNLQVTGSSPGTNYTSGVLVSAGDQAVVWNATAGQTIQVYGGLSGSENLITTYEVQDTLG